MEPIAKKLRKAALRLSYQCQDGNLQSTFSCMDIIWTLYDKIMHWSPEIAQSESRDFLIISKGQATLAIYPALIEKGMFQMEEIETEIGGFNSRYSIQTDITKFQGGVENSAGSLGHGLPFAAGIAHASKIKNTASMVYVLCGDGEFCEGTMWEACLFANTRRLDNLCVIVDDNSSAGAMVDLGDLSAKFSAFGLDVFSVDGHDLRALEAVFRQTLVLKNGRPKAIIAHTVRGYGSPTMTDHDVWFHKAPNSEELQMLMREVEQF